MIQSSASTTFIDPMSQDYLLHDIADGASAILSPCDTEVLLNINSQVRLTGASGLNGLLTADSLDTKFTQVLYLN